MTVINDIVHNKKKEPKTKTFQKLKSGLKQQRNVLIAVFASSRITKYGTMKYLPERRFPLKFCGSDKLKFIEDEE